NVDSNVFQNAGSWTGITGTTAWRFTTKPAAPAAGNVVVAADGFGDFCTVQGAIDFYPSGNTTPRTIQIQTGTYREIVYNSSGNQAYFTNCLVQGNVDYVWGLGTVYFDKCEIRSIARSNNPNGYICQPRNDASHNGIAFVDCQVTGSDNTFTNQFLARNNKNDSS